MNADGKGLFAAICADPNDDTPRLIYADWLDDQGEAARASALRMSVERHRLPDWEPRAWVLDARLFRHWQRHHKSWESALLKLPNVIAEVERSGLVESVHVGSPAVLLRQEEAIFSLGPIRSLNVMLTNATFSAKENAAIDAAVLASCRSLAHLRSLKLSAARNPEELKLSELASSPSLGNLRHLDLSSSDFSSPQLRCLARCPPFPCLESLDLSGSLLSQRGLDALAEAPLMATIQNLDLRRCFIGNSGLRQLLRCPSLAAFRAVILGDCGLGPRIFKSFFEADWQALEFLDVSENDLGSAMTRQLGRSASMKHLRWLDVSACQGTFGDGAIQALADSEYLDQLRVLDVGFNDLTHVGIKTLSEAPWIENLNRLALTGTDLESRDFAPLAAIPLKNLRWLEMNYGKINDREVPALLALPCMEHLTHLKLDNNQIGAVGARLLAASPALEHMESLDLSHNRIAQPERELLHERFGDRVQFWDSPDD